MGRGSAGGTPASSPATISATPRATSGRQIAEHKGRPGAPAKSISKRARVRVAGRWNLRRPGRMVVIFGEVEPSGAMLHRAWRWIDAPRCISSGCIGHSQSSLDAAGHSIVIDNIEHCAGNNLFRVTDADWCYQTKVRMGSASPASCFFRVLLEYLPRTTARCAPL